MDFAARSNKWYIVIPAYIAAFLPWTAFSAKDFISSEWKSVRHTRIAGYINLVCSILPALYILMYCATQFAAEDWKEGSAAVVPLLFALLHAARTAWGLWQLYNFHSWCAQSNDALRLMGISVSFTDKTQPEDPGSSWSWADEFLVNNSIVDNQLLNGDVKTYLCYNDMPLEQPRSSSLDTWRKAPQLLWGYVEFLAKSVFFFIVMMQDGVRFIFGFETSGKLRQVPKEPAEVWVNWAIAFAARGLQVWMSDFHAPSNPRADDEGMESRNGLVDWQRRASFFASEVLTTSILQLWPEVEGGESSEKGSTGPMVWNGWEKKSVAHAGRVARKELIEMAAGSGEGLPFGEPHGKWFSLYGENEEPWSGEKGYRAYGRHLASKVDHLDVRKEFCPQIEKLDVNMLECLTILLYLGARSKKLSEEVSRGSSSGEDGDKKSSGSLKDCATGARNSDTPKKENEKFDQAFENLRTQLSLPLNPDATGKPSSDGAKKFTESMQVVPSLPLSDRWKSARSKNRNVLRVGEVVDIWLALVAGDGIKFVMTLNNKWASVFNNTAVARGGERTDAGNKSNERMANFHPERSEDASLARQQHFQTSLEKARLQYQFGDEGCISDWGMNFGMTFMGYRMEVVRSYLAEWVYRMKNDLKNEDEVNLPSTFRSCVGGGGDSRIELSEALSRSLKTGNRSTTFRSRQFHLRLLWELQEHFASEVESLVGCENDAIPSNGPQSLALMALCLLSFPSINIELRNDIVPNQGIVTESREWHGIPIDCGCEESTYPRTSTCGDKKIELAVAPTCGPQKGQVRVRFDADECASQMSAWVSVSLENEDEFFWEWWRDAFIGRLEGMREWQEEHYMVSTIPVVPSAGSMKSEFEQFRTATKETFEVWKGWRPFRPEICMFEMKRNQLLKSSQLMRGVAKTELLFHSINLSRQFGFSRQTERDVSYEHAELPVINHAMDMIRESISQGWRVHENEHVASLQEDGESEIQDPFAKSEEMFSGDVVNVERVLRLFETSVVEFGNEMALEKGLEFILRSVYIPDAKAAELLHRVVSYLFPFGIFTGSRIGTKAHEKLLHVVWSSCKKLVLQCEMSSIYGKLVDVLLLLAAYGHENMRDEMRVLMEVLLCRLETDEALFHFSVYFLVAFGAMRPGYGERPEIMLEVNGSQENLAEKISASFQTVSLEPDWPYLLRILERIQGGPQLANVLCARAAVLAEFGDTVAMDASRPGQLVERAIKEGGGVNAMITMALLLENGGNRVPADAVRARELYERAIKEGQSVNAMVYLAVLLQNGADGVAADAVEAQKLYERAIKEGGHVSAMNNLAVLLQNGADGVEVDAVRARKLYERAIKEGGHVKAMNNLAVLLRNGADGVEVDAVQAQDLCERAVKEGGDVQGMYKLALLLHTGADGVEVNAVRAQELYERAIVEGGHVGAMSNLAVLLEKGADGVAVDAVRAQELYERAIKNGGDVAAMNNLAELLENGADGVAVDAARAQELYERAIKEGRHVGAMNNLAVLLENGADGVAVDAVRAKELFSMCETAAGESGDALVTSSYSNGLGNDNAGYSNDRTVWDGFLNLLSSTFS